MTTISPESAAEMRNPAFALGYIGHALEAAMTYTGKFPEIREELLTQAWEAYQLHRATLGLYPADDQEVPL
jgi:hypothetical protein